MPIRIFVVLLPSLLVASVAAAQNGLPRVIASDFHTNHSGRLFSFGLSQPESTTDIGPLAGPAFLLGLETFEGLDHSSLVGLSADHRFWRIDSATGAHTEVGLASIPWPQNWAGLARNPNTGELFAAANCFQPCDGSRLYRVAPDYQSVSLIGMMTNVNVIIDIAFDNDGLLYGLDIAPDQLVLLDPGTATGTVVGPVGFNANFGQGMDFDRRTNTLFLFSYSLDTSRAELRSVDTLTGYSEFIGNIGDSTFFTVEGVIEEAPPSVLEIPTLSTTSSLILILILGAYGVRTAMRMAACPFAPAGGRAARVRR